MHAAPVATVAMPVTNTRVLDIGNSNADGLSCAL